MQDKQAQVEALSVRKRIIYGLVFGLREWTVGVIAGLGFDGWRLGLWWNWWFFRIGASFRS